MALALREKFPRVAVYVAEPKDFDDYGRSLQAGVPQRNEKLAGSISDALLAHSPGAISFEMNRARLAGGLVASDPEALVAVGFAFDELRLVVEPAAPSGWRRSLPDGWRSRAGRW